MKVQYKALIVKLNTCLKKIDDTTQFVLLTFCFVLFISAIPEFNIPNTTFKVKSVDLLSDLQRPNKQTTPVLATDTLWADSSTLSPYDELAQKTPTADTATPVIKNDTLNQALALAIPKLSGNNKSAGIKFEDYTCERDGISTIVSKIQKIQTQKRPFRIGFLGDSFIEGDIVTADIRDCLQKAFGGRGVGFVNIAHVASKFRTTIEHDFQGWNTFSMIKFKAADWTKMLFTGYYFTPQEGATVTYKSIKNNERLSAFSTAKLLFINEKNTKISVSVNGGPVEEHHPISSDEMQAISFEGDIKSLHFKFDNVAGFYGYGVLLNDNEGVIVDNFSVRGSSGMVLSTSSKKLCSELRNFVDYDVIVLQYGLNVVSSEVTNYNSYRKTMIGVVNQLKEYFPETIFIVMSVGDRGVKANNEIVTMPGVLSMVNTQREIAKETNVLFWDTFSAMGGKNSMQSFASSSPPLANKDYTHINKAGGKRIAEAFIVSLKKELENATIQ